MAIIAHRSCVTLSIMDNIFLRQAIRENGIPFEVKLNVPNETTATAIREGRTIAYDRTATGYGNMADLRAALEA